MPTKNKPFRYHDDITRGREITGNRKPYGWKQFFKQFLRKKNMFQRSTTIWKLGAEYDRVHLGILYLFQKKIVFIIKRLTSFKN